MPLGLGLRAELDLPPPRVVPVSPQAFYRMPPCLPRHPYYTGVWHGMTHEKARRVAKSPVPDTARQSTHRKVRLVIRVDEGLGGCLHPLQRLCQTHRRTPSVP